MQIRAFVKTLNYDRFETAVKWNIIDAYFYRLSQMRLKNRDFSIICNNCIGSGIYHKLGMQYTSPTIGLFFFSGDYIRFLENFLFYIKQPLTFIESSRHPKANELRITEPYPIGLLGNDVELHFLHYKNKDEAASKWARRVKRLKYENLFFIYSDGGGAVAGAGEYDFDEEYLLRYERLPFEHKIFLSSKPRSSPSVIYIPDYATGLHVGDSTRNRKYEKYVNLVKWLNNEQIFSKTNSVEPQWVISKATIPNRG